MKCFLIWGSLMGLVEGVSVVVLVELVMRIVTSLFN